MEISLLKTLGQIAGIGGVSLGIFFLLLSFFIRKNIFPRLSNDRAYRLIRQFQYLTFAIAVLGISAWSYANFNARQAAAVYRVRVVLLGEGTPVENATVWSSVGGETKRVPGGYEVDIPQSTIPRGGGLTLFAEVQSAFLRGKKEINLTNDFNPSIILDLTRDTTASIRGMAQDEHGKILSNVRISLPGYGNEAVITSSNGSFVLPAHASAGQQVEIHAEKMGYKSLNQLHPAGDEPAILILEKNR